MTDKAKLLKVKANLKKRQPKFLRQDIHKFRKSAKQTWRRPKGLHGKVGDGKKGYRAHLESGYRTPKAVRGMDKHGLYPTLVHTLAQLDSLDSKTHSLVVGGTVGAKKRLSLLEAAKAKGFRIANLPADAHEKIVSKRKAVSEAKVAREKAKAERQKAAEAKSKKSDKKSEKAEKSDEEQNDPPMEPHAHKHKDDKKESKE